MRRITMFALAAGVLILGPAARASAGAYDPKVGERHPDFTLPAFGDRAPVSLSDFHGKKVLLIQFASW